VRVVILNKYTKHNMTNYVRKEANKKGVHCFFWPNPQHLLTLLPQDEKKVEPQVQEIMDGVEIISDERTAKMVDKSDKSKGAGRGQLKDFVASLPVTAESSPKELAEKYFNLVPFKTTLGSLTQAIGKRRRELGSNGSVPPSERKSKEPNELVQMIDDAIAALELVKDKIIKDSRPKNKKELLKQLISEML
jgi:hypothetical protein